jgi:hypothetical protein
VASQFHAVSIKPGATACDAVNSIEGARFLSKDAPPLPLADCTNPDCRCTYEHYEDRRSGPRRDSDVGLPSEPPDEERRMRRGRRETD